MDLTQYADPALNQKCWLKISYGASLLELSLRV